MKLAPARLEPLFVPRIWGTRSLAPLFAEVPSAAEPIGEIWLTGTDCRIAAGPFAGRSLGEVWPELPPEWTGTRLRGAPRIPLLVKFLFAGAKLSVQVHPDDTYAQKHEAASGGSGKTEMWYVIGARPGAEVLVGLKREVTPESFRGAIAAGSVEDCLQHVPLREGDAVFVPAGTAHTIGPGLVLCEIQEYSDITYRVFDYNRLTAEGKSRPLHIQQALNVIQFGQQSGGKLESLAIRYDSLRETYFVACRYFATEKWEFRERIGAVSSPEHFDVLILLAGSGKIEWSGGTAEYGPAQVWLLPAALGAFRLTPDHPTTLLRTYVPDLKAFARRLAERRVAESEWSRLVRP